MTRRTASIAAVSVALLLAWPAAAAQMTKCKIRYDIAGWSIIYKHSTGDGRITCSNGQTANVLIVTHGGGLSIGTHKLINGTGTFSAVRDIRDLYGGYAEALAHAGAGATAAAGVVVKRNASLTLVATGQGVSLGLAFGSFRIEPQ